MDGKGIVILSSDEISRRVSRDSAFLESGADNPLGWLRLALEKIADENSIVSRFEIDTKGREGVQISAVMDMAKIRRMRAEAREGR